MGYYSLDMNNNLLFFSIARGEERDRDVFGFFLYDKDFNLISQGKYTDPAKIAPLLLENTPITYDVSYQSEALSEVLGEGVDLTVIDLFLAYRLMRHLHFYVDIIDCLSHLGRFDDAHTINFDVEDSDPKDIARLTRIAFEEIGREYNGSTSGILACPYGRISLSQSLRINHVLDLYRDYQYGAFTRTLRGNFKKFLVLDLECSNTDYEEGKICEFSYSLFDPEWKLLQKEEILINPGEGDEFDFKLLGRPGSRDLHLKYEANDYEAYRKAKTFPEVADKITALLDDPTTLVFGYEVSSDLRFLTYTYKRYGLDYPDINAIDVKRVYEGLLGYQMHGLGDLVSRYVPEEEAKNLQFHSAVDDAYATGLVMKCFLLLKGESTKDLLNQCYEDVLCNGPYSYMEIPEIADPEIFAKLDQDGLLLK